MARLSTPCGLVVVVVLKLLGVHGMALRILEFPAEGISLPKGTIKLSSRLRGRLLAHPSNWL